MGRKVSVALEADVAGFVRPVEGAAKSADDLGDKVERLDHELNKLPADAAKAGAAMKLLGGSVDDVGNKVTDLGEKNTSLAVLDSKIRSTRGEVKKLADEFVKTGDVDVFKKLGDAEGRLRGLQDVRKKIADALTPGSLVKEGEKAGEGFFKGVLGKIDGFGEKLSGMLPEALSGALATPVLGPIIAAALIAALVVAMSTVMATAGGLVLAAGGAGIVGAGIMGAIMGSPEVVGKTWSKTIADIKAQFVNATQPFQQPLLDAAHDFASAIGGIDMNHIFAQAATFLPPLVKGAAEFARFLGEGIGYLVDGAGPAVAVLGKDLGTLGQAFSIAMKSIANGGEGGAQALHDLLGTISMIVAGLGGMIGFFEKLYVPLAKFRDAVIPRDWLFPPDTPAKMETGARALHGLGDAAKSTVVDLDVMKSKISETVTTVDSLEAAMVGKIFAATMGLDQATLGVAESQEHLRETFEESRKTLGRHADQLDINTKQGEANREAVLAAVTANMSMYQAQIAVGMSAEDASAAYDQNTMNLEANMRQAGLTQGQIDGLIGKYKDVPHKVDTDVAIHGLTDAINGLSDLLKQINGIHDKTVTIYYRTQGQSLNAPMAHGGIRRAAVGMVIPPSDPGTTLVGEPQTGGEALIPLRGISQGRAMSLAQTVGSAYGFSVSSAAGGGGGGGRTLRVVVQYPDGRVIRDQVVEWNANRGRSDPADFFLP
jgi:hypothetical protein